MAIEAIARVVRSGNETVKLLEDLNAQAEKALENLGKIEAHPGQRQEIGRAEEVLRRFQTMSETIRRQVRTTAPPAVSDSSMPPPAGRSFTDLSAYGRPLSEEERAHYRNRYSDERLDRARMIGPGRIVVPRETGILPQVTQPQPPAPVKTPEPPKAREAVERPKAPEASGGAPVAQPTQAAKVPEMPKGTEPPPPAQTASPYTRAEPGKKLPGMVETDIAGTFVSVDTPYGAELLKTQELQRQFMTTPSAAVSLAARPRKAAPKREPQPLPEVPAEDRERIQAMRPLELRRERKRLETETGYSGGQLTGVSPEILAAQAPDMAPNLARLEAVKREEIRRTTEEMGRRGEVQRRGVYQTKLESMGNRQLVGEWQTQSREANRLTREIDQLERARDKAAVGSEHAATIEQDLTGALQGQRQAVAQAQATMREGRERGLPPGMFTAGRGGLLGTMGAVAAGALAGGGSAGGFMGATTGALLSSFGMAALPASLGAAAVGYGVGKWWQAGNEYQETERATYGAGMRLGGGWRDLRAFSARLALSPAKGGLAMPYEESIAARQAYAMQTGRRDVGGILTLAAASGLPPAQLAAMIGGVGALGVLPKGRAITTRVPLPWGEPYAVRPFDQALTAMRSAEAQAALAEHRLHGGPLRGVVTPGPTLPQPAPPTERDLWRKTATRTGDISGYLAAGYNRSAYAQAAPENRDAFRAAYFEQWGNIAKTAGAGGLPIPEEDFGAYAGMLSAASKVYGPEVNPAFAGQLATTAVTGLTQPQNAVTRGIALRAIMGLSPEQREIIKRETTGQGPGKIASGFDVSDVFQAQAVLQAGAELPAKARNIVMPAVLGGYRGVVGKGTPAAEAFFTNEFAGGNAALGIQMERNIEPILGGLKTPLKPESEVQIRGYFATKFGAAGEEAVPVGQAAEAQERMLAAGKSAAETGQALYSGIQALAEWLFLAKQTVDQFETSGTLPPPVTSLPSGVAP